jgi:hypothetical protein
MEIVSSLKAFEVTEIGGSLFFFKGWEPVVLLPIF